MKRSGRTWKRAIWERVLSGILMIIMIIGSLPAGNVFAGADKYCSSLQINVTEPAAGESLANNDGFELVQARPGAGSMAKVDEWSWKTQTGAEVAKGSKAAGGTVYVLYAVISGDSDHKLTASQTTSIRINNTTLSATSYTFDESHNKVTISYAFPATSNKRLIKEININILEPAQCASGSKVMDLLDTATIDNDSDVMFDGNNAGYMGTKLRGPLNGSEDVELPETTTYINKNDSTVYKLFVRLRVKDAQKAVFDQDLVPRVNGKKAEFQPEWITVNGTLVEFYYTFIPSTYLYVTFDTQGHGEEIPEQGVPVGGHATTPETPKEAGWVFEWWQKPNGDGSFSYLTELEDVVITQNTTFKAGWSKLPYMIKYDYSMADEWPNKPAFTSDPDPSWAAGGMAHNTPIYLGDSISDPNEDPAYCNLTKKFYQFDKWECRGYDGKLYDPVPDTQPADQLTFTALFTPKNYSIVYNMGTGHDGAKFTDAQGVEDSDYATVFATGGTQSTIQLPDLADGIQDQFLGWYLSDGTTRIDSIRLDPNSNSEALDGGISISDLPLTDDDELVLTAKWGKSSWGLNWDRNGGSYSSAYVSNVDFGTTVTPPGLSRDNYTQTGWEISYSTDYSNYTKIDDLDMDELDSLWQIIPDDAYLFRSDGYIAAMGNSGLNGAIKLKAIWQADEYCINYQIGQGAWKSWRDYPEDDPHTIQWMPPTGGTGITGKDYFIPADEVFPDIPLRSSEIKPLSDSQHFVGWYSKPQRIFTEKPNKNDPEFDDAPEKYQEALRLYENNGWDENARVEQMDQDTFNAMIALDTTGSNTLPLYARFDLNSPELSWDFDGGEPDGAYSPERPADGSSVTLNTGDEVDLPADVIKTGYDFINWEFYLEGSATPMTAAEIEANLGNQVAQGKVSMPNHALLIKAVFAPTDYTVTYENGFAKCGRWKNDLTWSAGEEGKDQFTCETATFNVRKPSDDMIITEGYEFVGWYDGSDPTNKVNLLAMDPDTATKEQYDRLNDYYTKITSVQSGTKKNQTLVAVWKRKSYTVTWNLNGAKVLTDGSWDTKFSPSVELLNDTYVYQTNAQYKDLIQAPDLSGKREGYIFKGWYTESGIAAADGRVNKAPVAASYDGALSLDDTTDVTMPADKLTVYAVWEVETYTISYQYDDTMCGFESQAPETYTCEKTVTFPDLTPNNIKYEFYGWYTAQPDKPLSPDAVWNEDMKLDGTSIGMTGNLVLYPRWKIRMESFTLDFDNGTVTGDGAYTKSGTYEYGKELTFPVLTKRGYTFEGWTIQATADGVQLLPENVKPEDTQVNYKNLTKSLSCKAIFKPITYYITYNRDVDTDGVPIGNFASGERVLYSYTIEDPTTDYTFPAHVATDRPDMTFIGWYKGDSRPADPDPSKGEDWNMYSSRKVEMITAGVDIGDLNLWAVWIGNKEYQDQVKKELAMIETLIKAVEAQLIDGKVVLTPEFEQKLETAWNYYGGSMVKTKDSTSVEAVAKLIGYHDDFQYLAQQKAAQTVESIKAIGDVTYDDLCEARINKAREAYDEANPVKATSKLIKTMMPKASDNLIAAEQKYAALGAKNKTDQSAATAALKKMQDISDSVSLTSADKAAIDDAVAAYEALTADQKKLLPSSAVNRMYTAAETYENLAKTNAENRKQANEAIAKLKLVPTDISLTDSDKKTMEDARKTYDALTGEQKNLVPKDLVANLEKAEKDYVAKTEAVAKKKYQAAYKKWAKKNTSEAKITKKIKKTKTDTKNVKGAKYINLKLVAYSQKDGIRLKWKRVKKAKGYLIYGAPYGSKMRLLDTVVGKNKTSWSQEELSPNSYYKYIVVAYTNVKKFRVKKVLTVSETVYASPKSDTLSNPKSVDNGYLTSSVVASPGEKLCVEAQMIMDNKIDKQLVGVRYESSNGKVATVDSKGNVVCKKPGKAVIYAIAQNGLAKGLSIMVNKEQE